MAAVDRALARRGRLPGWTNRLVDWIADHPMSLAGRIAAARIGRPSAEEQSSVLMPGAAPIRVLIGPVNYSGQARAWAAALEAADDRISARNLAIEVPGGFDFAADLVVSLRAYHNGGAWQRRQFESLRGFTHVLVEASEPLLGRRFGRDVDREVAELAAFASVAWMSHGSEVRRPSLHAARTRWSPYRDSAIYAARQETLAARHIERILASGFPSFVSTPDLLEDVPGSRWVPVVVDPTRWDRPRARPEGAMRVVHAPSNAGVKGTALIEPVVHRLEELGAIRYRRLTGVPSARMPEAFAAADIVLDQFGLGSYGVGAVEAMASGAVVVGHVIDGVRDLIRESTGLDVPIVEATPDTLSDVLEELVAAPERRAAVAEDGRRFVAEVHDGRRAAAALIEGWIGEA